MDRTKEVILQFDGSSHGNPGESGIGHVVFHDDFFLGYGEPIGEATNNEAEYESLISGLKGIVHKHRTTVNIQGDSELVVKQMRGEYNVNASNLKDLHRRANDVLYKFNDYEIERISRKENSIADKLADEAAKFNK